MDYAVRRFARNILLIHLALLAIVLGIVYFASRAVQQGAREQALRQSTRRQEQLTANTARGIQGFYENILSDMDLVPRTEDTQVERTVLPELMSKTATKTPLGGRGVLIGFLLARQLEDRVSHLFVIDKGEMVPRALLREDLQAELALSAAPSTRSAAPAPAASRGRSGSKASTARLHPSGPVPTPAELEIVAKNREWLQGVSGQAVSKFEVFDSGGCNLIALPLGAKSRAVLVAAVPVDKINDKYLSRLNSDPSTGAFLVDETGTAMAASRPALVGENVSAIGDANVKRLLAEFRSEGYRSSTKPLSTRFKLGNEAFAPALLTAVPMEVVPGKRWILLVASPLAEVDDVVSALFRKVVVWAIFVTLAITAILLSTAITLIRSRAKAERERTAAIHKELQRARQIQQAWLPRHMPASQLLELAAVNYPAQHISGDFYNWFDLPDGRTAVVIGDVTGHGMSAAFLMATTQLLVRTTMQRITDPGRCMEELNRQLCTQVFNGQFVTLLLLVIDGESGAVEMATAGHPAPLLVIENDHGGPAAIRPLSIEPQLVLGVEEDVSYETEHVDLGPGSSLLLYTDGAPDVEAPDGRRFGSEGLRKALPRQTSSPADGARALVDAVVKAVNAFRGSRQLGDDLTLVAVKLKSAGAAVRTAPLAAVVP